MNKEDKRAKLAGYIDGELSDEERRLFEREIAGDKELQAELEDFMRLKQITAKMTYADLPDEVWESYWSSLYKKTERGLGWIFFSLGAIALLCFGIFSLLQGIFTNPEVPVFIKITVPLLLIGITILLVSFVRERLFAFNRERYREVNK